MAEIGTVTKRGTGRKDYSKNVEVSSIPQIRSYQTPAYYVKNFSVSAGGSTSFSETFDYAHFIYMIYITVDANVLIETEITSGEYTMQHGQGYQKIVEKIPASFPASELTVTVTNKSDIDLNGRYTHFGVKGLEKAELVKY